MSTSESSSTGNIRKNGDGEANEKPKAQADTVFAPRDPFTHTPNSSAPESTSPIGDAAQQFDASELPNTQAIQLPNQSTLRDLSRCKLGDFDLIRRLGSGGMADVYLAEQISLQRMVAIKVMRSDRIADPLVIQRFKHEATSAAALNHNNVVQVYAVGECDGIHYIAQEYVDGCNLRQYLKREGPPSTLEAIRILKQVASALQAAADAGIIHRDIKPENIMVTRKGIVKVTDFGLARAIEAEDVNLTQDGYTMGTPLYMSPEQIDGRPLDQRADIYSFGITAYQLLAGQPPFHGQTGMSIASQHLNATPPPLSERRQDIPIELCATVHKMIEKSLADRHQSANDVLAELRQLEHIVNDFTSPVHQRPQHSFPVARFVAVCLSMVVLGAIGGALYQEKPLTVANATLDGDVPAFDSIEEQYLHAMVYDTEQAWQAVVLYFPRDNPVKRRAEEHLALLYLREDRLRDCERLFRAFSKHHAAKRKAIGYAGLALVANRSGNHARSQEIIDQKLPELQIYLTEPLKLLIDEAKTVNQNSLKQTTNGGMTQILTDKLS